MASSVCLSLHFRRASVSSYILDVLHTSFIFFRHRYCRTNKKNPENLSKLSENLSQLDHYKLSEETAHISDPANCSHSIPHPLMSPGFLLSLPWAAQTSQPRYSWLDLISPRNTQQFQAFNMNSVNLGWLNNVKNFALCAQVDGIDSSNNFPERQF